MNQGPGLSSSAYQVGSDWFQLFQNEIPKNEIQIESTKPSDVHIVHFSHHSQIEQIC